MGTPEQEAANFLRTKAVVDLDAIVNNMEQMHKSLKQNTKMIGVIKTNGYGHGSKPIAHELEKLEYVFGYAVATAEEAMALRMDGIKKPILILGYTFPYAYDYFCKEEIRPAVFREDMLMELSKAALANDTVLPIHVKVDTGMGRIGIRSDESGMNFIKKVLATPGIKLEGIFTHFAKADEYDKSHVQGQIQRFRAFVDRIKEETKITIPYVHCSNSAGILELPDANMDLVRAGITLYGLMPSNEVSCGDIILKPALRWESRISYIKEVEAGAGISYGSTFIAKESMKIATVPVGYGDGYPRGLSGKGYVLISGTQCPILGRVCMDQFMVDVSALPNVKMGDVVTLLGTDGNHTITAEELGALSGRFNYELVCLIGNRVPRVYIKNGKITHIENYM